jgi:hypothetical protein
MFDILGVHFDSAQEQVDPSASHRAAKLRLATVGRRVSQQAETSCGKGGNRNPMNSKARRCRVGFVSAHRAAR